jgi:hypothetical protein
VLESRRIERWSLTSLKQWLVKTSGQLIKQAQYYWLLLAEHGGVKDRKGANGCIVNQTGKHN